MVIVEGNGGGRMVLIWWVSIHVNRNVWPDKLLANDTNVHCFYVNHYLFPSEIKHACLENVLKRLLKQNAFITKPETLDSFIAEIFILLNCKL